MIYEHYFDIIEPMFRDKRVLVHPSDDEKFGDKRSVWKRWTEEGAQRVTNGEDLIRPDYADLLPPGTRVVLGGQEGDICVMTHAESLIEQPKVRNGDVQIALSRGATYGGDLQKVAKELSRQLGKKVEIID